MYETMGSYIHLLRNRLLRWEYSIEFIANFTRALMTHRDLQALKDAVYKTRLHVIHEHKENGYPGHPCIDNLYWQILYFMALEL